METIHFLSINNFLNSNVKETGMITYGLKKNKLMEKKLSNSFVITCGF